MSKLQRRLSYSFSFSFTFGFILSLSSSFSFSFSFSFIFSFSFRFRSSLSFDFSLSFRRDAKPGTARPRFRRSIGSADRTGGAAVSPEYQRCFSYRFSFRYLLHSFTVTSHSPSTLSFIAGIFVGNSIK